MRKVILNLSDQGRSLSAVGQFSFQSAICCLILNKNVNQLYQNDTPLFFQINFQVEVILRAIFMVHHLSIIVHMHQCIWEQLSPQFPVTVFLLQVSCHYSSVAFNLSMQYWQSSINVWLQMLHSPLSRDCLFSLLKVDMVPYHSSLSSHLLRYTICPATSLLFHPGFSYGLSPGSGLREDLFDERRNFDKPAYPLRMVCIIALLFLLNMHTVDQEYSVFFRKGIT